LCLFFFQAEDGIRDLIVTGVQTCALPICRLRHVTFEEMIEMAGAGSKVLQIRAVEFAGKYRVPTRVLSSLTNPALPVEQEAQSRSEERRVGKECRARGWRAH